MNRYILTVNSRYVVAFGYSLNAASRIYNENEMFIFKDQFIIFEESPNITHTKIPDFSLAFIKKWKELINLHHPTFKVNIEEMIT